jgi:integrase
VARAINRLKDVTVRKAKKPGLLADGAGLYLRVGPTGSKAWVFRYRRDGRLHDVGLGPLHTVGLAEARQRAQEYRKLRLNGVDPLEARQAARSAAKLDAAKAITFRACADQYIAAHKAGWRNLRHAAQWPSTLAEYVYPTFGELPVQAVDVGLVLKALEPIWSIKPETASRVRGRIECVLDWATARGYRRGENPARWRGHLENLLPKRSKLARVEHHAALSYAEVGAFVIALGEQGGMAARALEFLILTAARTGEVIGARWDEFNLPENVWTVPAERMKSGREHRVALSDAAAAILKGLAEIRQGAFVFTGAKPARPLSASAMFALLRRMGRGDLTVHGFRSTFSDWCAERTAFPAEVREMALAHAVGDKVEAAYRRGDLFEKRRQLAEAWARFCAMPPASSEAVPLRTFPADNREGAKRRRM